MNVVRIITVPLLSLILFSAIMFGIPAAASSQVITNREEMKLLLGKKSVFESVSATLKTAADQSNATDEPGVSDGADQVALNRVVDHYLTVETYNRAVNSIVDGTYDFLDGKTTQPTFSVPLTDNKAEFQAFVQNVFIERFNSLPVCPAGSVDATYNPLEASCRPANYSSAQVSAFINDASSQPDFQQLYDNASINSEQIFNGANSNAAAQQQNWRLFKNLPWIIALIIVLAAGLLGLVFYSRRKSFKAVGWALLVPAGLGFITALIARQSFEPAIKYVVKQIQDAGPLKSLLDDLVGTVFKAINSRILLYSGIILIIAISLLITSRLLNPKEPKVPSAPTPVKP